jgi:hypothetical protein
VLYNLIRFSSQRGIVIERYFDATLDQDAPSSGNQVRGNLLTRNHTSGIHLPEGGIGAPQCRRHHDRRQHHHPQRRRSVSIPESDFDPASEPAAANTTLTDNIFDGNRTDICNESDSTTIGAGNVGAGNGAPTISDDCMVEPGGF